MKLRALLVLSVLLPLLACDGGGSGDVEPKSGSWAYNGGTVSDNTCSDPPPTDPEGNFTLTVTGDGRFTVLDGDFDSAFECTHDGESFNCPKRASGEVTEDGVDAVVTYNVSVEGTLESATALSGNQTVQVACEGGDCGVLAELFMVTELPCSYTYAFSAAAK
jgi:hypothetical protein